MNGAVMTGDPGLWIGILGPLLGTRDGVAVGLPRGRAGVLLAALALSVGRPVSAARLAVLIWDDVQPERARARLQTVVARLREVLPGVVVTTGDGYLLDIDPGQVDLWRFRALVQAAGEAEDPAAALGLLDQALGLWRGEPLADLRSVTLDREVVPGLAEECLSAVQHRAGLALAAGRHEQVIAELRGLTSRYPLREPLWALLLRALAAAGRPAEAIGEYQQAREILVGELGVDPSLELQEVYHQLLQADPRIMAAKLSPDSGREEPPGGDGPSSGVPRRLPADTRVFTGRQAELAWLLDLAGTADAAGGPGTVVISAIDGMAGIGKTALAVHTAHRLADRFGDGQLFIDLHGYTQGYPPRTADQALEVLLRALGVPPQQIPQDTEERAALYRERLVGTRTLIVLDNAADEAQVRPLIPGGVGCLVLITSRRKLKALDDAHTLPLDALPEPDAAELFRMVAGPGRITLDDLAVAEITGLCGRLPLAVRIAAALLRSRPTWSPQYLAGRLRAEHTRLTALSGGDHDLAALFTLSNQALDDRQQRLYRYLGLIPGPEIDAYAAAALLDTDPATAEWLQQDLVDHNLLLEPAMGRYQMHDLIRAHARDLATTDPAAEQQAALDRLLDYYQHTARRADARIARHAEPGPAPAHAPMLGDAVTARAWLRAERVNLTACLHYAIQGSLDHRTVALSAGLASLLRADGPWPQATAPQAAAAAAAARLGDQLAQARALLELGILYRLTGDYPAADHTLREALDLHREAGDKPGQAQALTELGSLRRLSSDYPGAEQSLRAALELCQGAGDQPGQALALAVLGSVQHLSGDYRDSEQSLRTAFELYREVGDKSGQALALTELMEVQNLTGRYESAIRSGEAALAMAEELGDRLRQANALMQLGQAQRRSGDYERSVRNQKVAIEVYRKLGDRVGQGNALTELTEVLRLTGDYEGAARVAEEAIGIFRDLGQRAGLAWALHYYAAAVSSAGDLTRAAALYFESLQLAREVRHLDDEAIALEGLGETLLRTGKPCDGAACLRQALEIYSRLGLPAAEQVRIRLGEIGELTHN